MTASAASAHQPDGPSGRYQGFLADDRLSDFFASLDAFALPSINSLEAFGIVQAEAMMAAVPVVASDRPGVRTLVQATGIGRIVPPRDPAAITSVLSDWQFCEKDHRDGMRETREQYADDAVVGRYGEILDRRATGESPAQPR